MPFEKKESNQFDRDVISNKGYLYTTRALKSSKLANKRLTEVTMSTIGKIKGKKVLDVGCGDGTYTYKLYSWGKPRMMVGFDVSKEAISLAQKKYGQKNKELSFRIHSCNKIPYSKKSFDIAIVRGLLHHLDDPFRSLTEIVRVADCVFIIEPNGYNPFLKLIEVFSPYHRQHLEKSYPPKMIRSWIGNLNRKIIGESYVGLVPFFCPSWMALFLKKIEPFFEKTPILRNIFCAAYTVLLVK